MAHAAKGVSITRYLGLGVARIRSSRPSSSSVAQRLASDTAKAGDDHHEKTVHGVEKHHIRRDVATASEPIDELRIPRVVPPQVGEQIAEILLNQSQEDGQQQRDVPNPTPHQKGGPGDVDEHGVS